MSAEYFPKTNAAADYIPTERDPASELNPKAEDRAASKSERTGVIPSSEVDALGGKNNYVEGKTRGVKQDAMKADREVDEAVEGLE